MNINIKAEFTIDTDMLKKHLVSAGVCTEEEFDISDAINGEFGWLEESGFNLNDWNKESKDEKGYIILYADEFGCNSPAWKGYCEACGVSEYVQEIRIPFSLLDIQSKDTEDEEFK